MTPADVLPHLTTIDRARLVSAYATPDSVEYAWACPEAFGRRLLDLGLAELAGAYSCQLTPLGKEVVLALQALAAADPSNLRPQTLARLRVLLHDADARPRKDPSP